MLQTARYSNARNRLKEKTLFCVFLFDIFIHYFLIYAELTEFERLPKDNLGNDRVRDTIRADDHDDNNGGPRRDWKRVRPEKIYSNIRSHR